MGTVYRETYTKPVPEGAETATRNGERIATWRDANGRKRSATLNIEGTRIVVRSGVYVAKWRDGAGVVRKRSTGCRDRGAALAVLAEWEKRAENVRAGVRTASEDSVLDHLATPIAEHVAAYLDHLRSKPGKGGRVRVSKMHADNVGRQMRTIIDGCGFERLRDLNRRAVDRWIDRMRSGRDPISARNVNAHTTALCAFGNWCVETGRIVANPLSRPPKLDERADRRRARRAMTDDELRRLLYVARLRPLAEHGREGEPVPPAHRNGRRTWTKAPLTIDTIADAARRARETLDPERIAELERLGRERALIYKALTLTGLRKGELASLTIGALELDGPTAYARLHAGDAKSGSAADIPIRADLADDLRAWIADRLEQARNAARMTLDAPIPARLPHDARLFNVPAGLVRIFDRDLAAAGIPKRDERGRTLDIHALRHTFGTHLSKGGVSPRTAQAAMRHSKLDLTMNVYTDPRLLDVAGALDALPTLDLDGAPTPERTRATGTDSRALGPMLGPTPAQACQNGSIPDTTARNAEANRAAVSVHSDGACHSLSATDEVEPIGIEPTTSCMPCKRSPN